jgi:hypothetical protein
MKVTGWTYWENDKYKDVDDMTDEQFDEATEAVINAIRSNQYKFTGESHQYSNYCTPIIDNEFKYNISMRSWGVIMQKAYDLPNDDGMGYVIWAWQAPGEEVFPNIS